MPRKPIDYSKTIIYKLVCKDLSVKDLYVGHTTNWIKRKSNHKKNCYNANSKRHNFKVYTMMRDNGSWDNWDMIEIEKYPCNDEREARTRERYWYEELHASMNTNRPIWTEEEKKEYEKNRDRTEYRNRPEVKEQKRINSLKPEQVEKRKQYRQDENNKQKMKEYLKDYRKKNKEILSQKQKEKYTCSCGSEIVKCTKSRHERSTKHKKYIESLN